MTLATIRRLGSSKYATVSECQSESGQRVAVRQVDKHAVSSFVYETIFEAAQQWRSFSHPGLVAYHSVDMPSGKIVMDLMEQSIETRIRDGYGDAKNVLFVLRGILYGLAYLHQRGLVHANLKPSNVFLDVDGRVRLSDGYLYSTATLGTLPAPTNQKYLTPEHTGDTFGGIAPATDLYTAGFIALEMFAGDRFGRGFQGIGEQASDQDHTWFQWHNSTLTAPDATVFYKACPSALASTIAKLVSKNPVDRFHSAEEALRTLPESISPENRAANTAPPKESSAQHVPSPAHILDRPSNGVVLAIASGPRAGEMIGTDDMEMAIGFESDCFVRFSNDDYPGVQSKVTCQRSAEGWKLVRVRGQGISVNQQFIDERCALRSGDIIRLSPRGPDIQFNLQSAGFSTKALATQFLTHRSSASRAASGLPSKPVAPSPRPAAPPYNPSGAVKGSIPAPRPLAAVTAHSPVPSSGPVTGRPPAPAPRPSQPKPLSGKELKPATSSQQGSNPVSPARPATSSAKVDTASSSKRFSMNPRDWTKNQKNLVITIVGVILIAIVVTLVPSEQPTNDPSTSKQRSRTNETEEAVSEPTIEIDTTSPKPEKTE